MKGTGKTGRTVERDIRAAARTQSGRISSDLSHEEGTRATARDSHSPEYREIAVSSIRKTIAERMLESKQTTAAVTITTTVDATNLVNLRRQFKAVLETSEMPPIGYTEIVVKLTAIALTEHPMLNSCWEGDHIRAWRSVHIGIAVDTDHGLKVAVVRDVPRLSLRELAACSRAACPPVLATER